MRDWLAAAAHEHPDRVAVEADDERAHVRRAGRAGRRAGASARRSSRASAVAGRAPRRASPSRAAARAAAPRRRARAADPRGAGRPGRCRSATPRTRSSAGSVRPDAVHTVIHTSGTTGEPKAVELTYANHAASAAASADALGVEPGDRWLCPLPLHHVGGLERAGPRGDQRHDRGARTSASTPSACGDGSRRGEVTLASLVPDDARPPARRRAPRTRPACARSRWAAARCRAGLLDWAAATGIPVTPVYGMTETCSQVVAGIPGRALRGVELSLAERRRDPRARRRWWRRGALGRRRLAPHRRPRPPRRGRAACTSRAGSRS